MILTELNINGFRNLEALSIEPHPSLNLITGNNGSGKTSILEAIQCLSTGYSFRTRKARELISKSHDSFTITTQLLDSATERTHRSGLMRHRNGKVELRLDFEDIHSMAEVTRLLPIKSLSPDSHKLLQEGPDERRQFLDWGVFHVEPDFLDMWRQFKRTLSQRNQLLRDNGPAKEINTWNSLYSSSAQKIDEYRSNYVKRLNQALQLRLSVFDTVFHVELHYKRGWNSDVELDQLLLKNIDFHRRMKTTTDGPHRAEVAITTEGTPARQILSRGQQKVLVYLLHLSQLDLLNSQDNRRAIILCDDLTSELDGYHSQQIIQQLSDLKSQIFVTGVDLSVLSTHEHKQFHMKHGVVEKVV